MRYASYKKYDMLNGQGIRNSLFVSGCTHKCKGCFNEKAQDFNYGKEFGFTELLILCADIRDEKVHGLSLLGGEPFQNKDLLNVVTGVKPVMREEQDIWAWTGYTFEELLGLGGWRLELLKLVDVLVDGKFVEEQKDLSLQFRGSRNQRIIDVKKSLEQGEVVLWQQDTIQGH